MKKKVFILFALLFSFAMFVNAEDNDVLTVGSTESINSDVLYADDNVEVDGKQDSSQFVFGNFIKATSSVAGIQFSAGNTLDINGSAEYGLYAGNAITINSNIEKDLFVAGNTINIGSKSTIGRDAYLVANSIKINVNVGRDLRAACSSLDISGITINGDVYLDVTELTMDENTTITGKLSYVAGTNIVGKDKASVGKYEEKESSDFGKVEINFGTTLTSQLLSAAAAIIVAIALFYFIPSVKKKLDDEELSIGGIGSSIGKGFAALLIIPIVSIIAAITGILTPIGLIVLALYIIGIYLASVLSGYIVGRVIMTNIFKNDNEYLSIVIGILLIRLLGLVPVVNGVVTTLCLLYGMGLLYKLIKKKN